MKVAIWIALALAASCSGVTVDELAAPVAIADAGPPETCENCTCADKDGDGRSLYTVLEGLKLQGCSSPWFACKVTNMPTPSTYTYEYCAYDDPEKKTGCGKKTHETTYSCNGWVRPECGQQKVYTYPVRRCEEREYEYGTPPKKYKSCTAAESGQRIELATLNCLRDPEHDYLGHVGYQLISTCNWAVDDLGKGTCLGHCSLARYKPDTVMGGCKRDLSSNDIFNTSFDCVNKTGSEPEPSLIPTEDAPPL